MHATRMSHPRGGFSSLSNSTEPSWSNRHRSLLDQNKSGLKRAILFFVLLLAFSTQIALAQDGTITPCPVEPIAPGMGTTAAATTLCPTPTPTPTPTPPPPPTPTPIAGALGPKYLVLTVTYAPPGSSSNVVYSNSTMRGVSNSMSHSFTTDTTWSASLTAGWESIHGIDGFDSHSTVGYTGEVAQESENSTSFDVNFTNASSTTVPGPSNSAVGLDHDQDLIWIWLNPVVLYDVNSDTNFTWKGFGYDLRDPVNTADILGIPVKYLNGHATMPANLAAVLQRSWAPAIRCSSTDPACGSDGTKGPGLTASDFADILKADPFTDPSYLVNVPAGSTCTADHRFCHTNNQNLQYLPPPPGGQPISQTYTLTYEAVATAGLTATTTTSNDYSAEFGVSAKLAIAKFELKLAGDKKLTWEDKVGAEATQQAQQTATATITGPEASDNYTGPVQLDVFQDNVYGTFMFNFVPVQTFSFTVNPSSLGVIQGSCANYNLLVSALIANFGGTITFQVSGLPANVTGNFSPASLSGSGSSILTVCAAPSASLGTYGLLITGSYGAEVHSIPVTLGVNPPPNFTLTASPSGQTVIAGNSANFTVSTGSVSGFAGNVALSISGLPAGVSATFSPVTVAVGSSSTLHISTTTGVPPGSYRMVVTGVSGGISHSANVVLGVTAPPPPPPCTKPPCRVQN